MPGKPNPEEKDLTVGLHTAGGRAMASAGTGINTAMDPAAQQRFSVGAAASPETLGQRALQGERSQMDYAIQESGHFVYDNTKAGRIAALYERFRRKHNADLAKRTGPISANLAVLAAAKQKIIEADNKGFLDKIGDWLGDLFSDPLAFLHEVAQGVATMGASVAADALAHGFSGVTNHADALARIDKLTGENQKAMAAMLTKYGGPLPDLPWEPGTVLKGMSYRSKVGGKVYLVKGTQPWPPGLIKFAHAFD